jgi:hypothetical protein
MARIKAAVGALLLAFVATLVPHAEAAPPRHDAEPSRHYYFPSSDALTTLHAEVLRPYGAGKRRTPVIMTVSPYFTEGVATSGSSRFYDFLDVTKILRRGYTYVAVDLPGFGGSSGCNDWGGPREQGAVKAAVEWGAKQPWSTGRVGLMGKSYDAWTGLMGIAQQPKGLAAVVAMEPVFSGYRYLYTNGVRFPNSVGTPVIFQVNDVEPAWPLQPPQYIVNGLPQLWCYGPNVALQQQDDPAAPHWRDRDLLRSARGKRTPLFLTQGFLETNTKPDGAFDYFNMLVGPKRAWFGQFDHVRGWEKIDGEYAAGRKAFAGELVRFLDRHLKGARVPDDPIVEVQDNLGRYRAETRWPPSDVQRLWSGLEAGSYTDDGQNFATGTGAGNGLWSFSQPAPHDIWMAGEPLLDVTVETAVPRTNLVGNVYDVEPGGRATLVSRGAMLMRGTGRQRATVKLYGQDWLIKKGHRIGVLVSGANTEWWSHVPTGTDVTVVSARVRLPFLTYRRTSFIDGESTSRLYGHLNNAVTDVAASTIKAGTRPFTLPARLR